MSNSSDEISFLSESKETMKDRLLQLIGTRSRRQAAEDWGIKYATLNNYLTARESLPRPNVVKQIADAEGVDSNWILYGASNSNKETTSGTPLNANVQFICDMMSVLSESETESLRNVLIREGIKTLLALTEEDNLHLINLNQKQKKAALMLEHLSEEKVREILQGDAPSTTTPTVNIANSKG
ncbi:transcriptional regulator [Serratia marcescens]|nr:transcriptional regulator [Serratia marcescens]